MITADCHLHTQFSTDSEAPMKSMIEAAIASIEAIYDWRAFQREELAGDGADSDGQAGAQA